MFEIENSEFESKILTFAVNCDHHRVLDLGHLVSKSIKNIENSRFSGLENLRCLGKLEGSLSQKNKNRVLLIDSELRVVPIEYFIDCK